MKKHTFLFLLAMLALVAVFLISCQRTIIYADFNVDAGKDKTGVLLSPVEFNGRIVISSKGNLINLPKFDKYKWDFGDGNSTILTTNATVTHKYTKKAII